MAKYQFTVEVVPEYLPDQSAPDDALYVFAYTITITNTGDVTAQLISRTWNVNDANGHTDRVKGLARLEQRLLPDHAEALDLLGVAVGVVHVPGARDQLRADLTDIGDGDGVRKNIQSLLRR